MSKATKASQPRTRAKNIDETSVLVAGEQKMLALREENALLKRKLLTAYRENEATEVISEVVRSAVETIPRVRVHAPANKPKDAEVETAVALLSCIHAGEVVRADEMEGLGEYNFAKTLERCQAWEDVTYEMLTNKFRGYKFRELRVLALGDFVSGIIHQELLETNEFPIVEQAIKIGAVMAQALVNLHVRLGIPIKFEGVVGNHGRVKKEYYFKNSYVNWDYVCYQQMQMMCSEYRGITFNIPKSFFHLTEIEGKRVLFFHGNNIKSWQSIPWYGINRTAANFQAVLAGFGKSYDYMMLSHFHQNGMVDAVRGEYIMNGTWKGGDEYALGALSVVADPRQWLFSMHPRKGITWRLPISLRFAKKYDGRYNVCAYGELNEVLEKLRKKK